MSGDVGMQTVREEDHGRWRGAVSALPVVGGPLSQDMIRPSGASTRKNFIISKIWQSFHKTKLLSQSRHPRNVAKENCELGRPFFQASQPSFTVRDTEDCDEVYKFAKKNFISVKFRQYTKG